MTVLTSARVMPSRLMMPLLILGAGVFALLQSLVTPALPQIQRELGTTASAVAWTLTAYLLSAGVCTPLIGRVGDLYGRVRVLGVVLAVLAGGCMLAGFAPNIGVLIGARVLQGVSGAILPLSFGIVRAALPAERSARGIATISSVIGAGGGLGVVLAGPVTDTVGYRWLFWIPGAVAACASVAVLTLLPSSLEDRVGGRIGWAGAALLTGWLVVLLLGVSMAPAWGWTSWATLTLVVLAAALVVLWIVVESHSRHPLIDMEVMRMRAVWPANAAAALFGAGIFAVFALLPRLAVTPRNGAYGLGLSVTGAGLLLLPMLAAMFVTGVVSGRIGTRVPARTQLTVAGVLGAFACALLALRHDSVGWMAVASGVFGIGTGAGIAAMSNVVVASVPSHQVGAASGMNANLRTIGGALGTAAITAIAIGNPLQDGPPSDGYTLGFAVLAVLCIAAAASATLIPRPSRR